MGSLLSTVAELRAIESAAQVDLPAGELMARAGRAAARRIDALAGEQQRRIAVIAGPGNNGGDGFVVASELATRGHRVRCVLVGATEPQTTDARAAFERWRKQGEVLSELPDDGDAEVVVDALFGIGLARPLQDEHLAAAQWINAQRARVVALDVPSGLDADRGCWVGGVDGVRAATTITFIGDKPGLHTGAGVDAAGEVVIESLGLRAPGTNLALTAADDLAPIVKRRRRDTHKGSYGDALIVGGGAGMVGAPLLAARAALRIGAGRVYVDCIGAPELAVDPQQPELMFRKYATLERLHAVVAGCGLGVDRAAHEALAWSIAASGALVIDADGLNVLAESAALQRALAARAAPTVLTPHPLEAARLVRSSAAQVQGDRIAAARAVATAYRCLVVLKGAGSVIASVDRAAINPTGGPALATAGTGDVLAGMIGGLLAQGYSAWDAVVAAVWLHGAAAGDVDRGLVAGEIATRAISVLQSLQRT